MFLEFGKEKTNAQHGASVRENRHTRDDTPTEEVVAANKYNPAEE